MMEIVRRNALEQVVIQNHEYLSKEARLCRGRLTINDSKKAGKNL